MRFWFRRCSSNLASASDFALKVWTSLSTPMSIRVTFRRLYACELRVPESSSCELVNTGLIGLLENPERSSHSPFDSSTEAVISLRSQPGTLPTLSRSQENSTARYPTKVAFSAQSQLFKKIFLFGNGTAALVDVDFKGRACR